MSHPLVALQHVPTLIRSASDQTAPLSFLEKGVGLLAAPEKKPRVHSLSRPRTSLDSADPRGEPLTRPSPTLRGLTPVLPSAHWDPTKSCEIYQHIAQLCHELELITHGQIAQAANVYMIIRQIFLQDPAFVEHLPLAELPLQTSVIAHWFHWQAPVDQGTIQVDWVIFLQNFFQAHYLAQTPATMLCFEMWVYLWKQMWRVWDMPRISVLYAFLISPECLHHFAKFLNHERNFIKILKHSVEFIPVGHMAYIEAWYAVHQTLIDILRQADSEGWPLVRKSLKTLYQKLQNERHPL